MAKDILSYGIGTLVAFAIVAGLAFIFISDITQKKHGVLRNYPVIGPLRYYFDHVRIVQASGQSVALNILYLYPELKARMKAA
jgi:hypothetical protein